MIFTETKLKGAYIIEPELIEDERGFFARTWCRKEFEAHGLNPNLAQCDVSFNKTKGTLRGMHYQCEPYAQAKLVRCTRGAIYDVALDLRTGAATRNQWVSIELTADNRRMLYIPEGMAHGFQTLADSSEIFYQMCDVYHPASARVVRWNDPAFGIEWPLEVAAISEKDANCADVQS